ncbi:MAG: M48 family metalloprotease [Rhodothermales bacterium]|nr:M48 family metalloprotease [Rhodothermales bacterium]
MPVFVLARSCLLRGLAALFTGGLAVGGYYCATDEALNPITGEEQRVGLTVEQEVALGTRAAPELVAQFGGLHPDAQAQRALDRIGDRLVAGSVAEETPYPFTFGLLADAETVNAFALPGGPIFVTAGLARRLGEAELAGVLAHEVAHVVARHAAEQLAKERLTQGLAGAAAILSSDGEGGAGAAVAQAVGRVVGMRHGREDELEADRLGVRIMAEAGYDPRAMIEVMRTLAATGPGARLPEFFSTHPNPDDRIAEIEAAIAEQYPDGLPAGSGP